MTRARAKAIHDKVNSLLTTLDLGTPLDGLLPHADVLCVIRYKAHQDPEEDETPWPKEGEEQQNLEMYMEPKPTSPEDRQGRKGRWPVTGPVRPAPRPDDPVTGPVNRARTNSLVPDDDRTQDRIPRRSPIMASPSINFNQFLEKEKLKSNGSNFTDWFRHVRIFLNGGNLQYVLDAPLGSPPPPVVSEEEKNVFEARAKVYSQVQCAILCSLEAELQKRFEHHDPCDMMRELKVIFETHAAVESYEASKQFFGCMMEEGSSVSEHMFAMSGHARKLSDLGIVIPNQLGIHRVLQSLPPSYKNFVMNYNMQNMNKELPELFSMLKSAEVEIQKEHQVLMVNKTTKFKKQGKPKKDLKKGGKKAAAPPEKPKGGPKPDTVLLLQWEGALEAELPQVLG
ncbi:hypothetical protein QYE76_006202 [Lolium multiflorum]|uniref:Uncharacterized protein n=1 Tax=Lolium multiflorum TaxID=4521 RepID=A0AAD8RW96_LOLMU|nr:hypothetical protein QYE76_006202 [Lolium multiflorum]